MWRAPLWMELQAYLEKELHAASRVEYSRCGMEPGWNVKFKQGGRSLCTVYMRRGYVTAMVSIGAREENAASWSCWLARLIPERSASIQLPHGWAAG